MSSHHFVKEGQEPALLIYTVTPEAQELVGNLLEWSPEVWVCDRALTELLKWGIKIDGVILQSDTNQDLATLNDQEPLKKIYYQRDFVEEGLLPLVNSNDKKISVVDFERALALRSLEELPIDLVNVFRGNEKWSLIKSGQWKKWLSAGSKVKVLAGVEETYHQVKSDGDFIIAKPGFFWVGEVIQE